MNQWKRVWAFWAYTKSFHKAKQNKIEPTKNIMDRRTIAGISLNGRLLFIRQLHPVQFSIHATFNVRIEKYWRKSLVQNTIHIRVWTNSRCWEMVVDYMRNIFVIQYWHSSESARSRQNGIDCLRESTQPQQTTTKNRRRITPKRQWMQLRLINLLETRMRARAEAGRETKNYYYLIWLFLHVWPPSRARAETCDEWRLCDVRNAEACFNAVCLYAQNGMCMKYMCSTR